VLGLAIIVDVLHRTSYILQSSYGYKLQLLDIFHGIFRSMVHALYSSSCCYIGLLLRYSYNQEIRLNHRAEIQELLQNNQQLKSLLASIATSAVIESRDRKLWYRSIISCHDQYYQDLDRYADMVSSTMAQISSHGRNYVSDPSVDMIWMMNYAEVIALLSVGLEEVDLMIDIVHTAID
jgi:hypothetical protein